MSNEGIVIRAATAADAATLTQLSRRAKQYWGYPDEWMAAWLDDLTVTPEYIARQPVGVLEVDGEIAGFYGLIYDGEETTLEHLWLWPNRIGRGLGRKLFDAAMERARRDGRTKVRIKADPNAEPFYLKMGAVRETIESYALLGRIRRDVPIMRYDIAGRHLA